MTRTDYLKIGSLLCLWLLLFFPLYPELVSEWWNNSDNSHAFLVPFITLFFIWRKWQQVQGIRPDSSPWGAMLLILSLAVYLVSLAGSSAFPARIAMVTSLFGVVWFCLGGQILRLLAFPLAFLLFLIPVPYSLLSLVSLQLQLVATHLSERLISLCTIPVYREGNMLFFVQTQLEVAEACSGIRSIVSLVMIGLVFCLLSSRGWLAKGCLVAAAVPIAMAGNIIRVTGTGLLAHFYGERVARGFLHEFSGLVVFGCGFLLLFALFGLLNRETHQ